jgi:hypothetical protein
MTEHTTSAAIARAFTQTWTGHDLDAAADYLAEEVTFEGPGGRSTGKAAYIEGLRGFAQSVTGLNILAAHGNDDEAMIMYEVTTAQPATLTCAELLTLRGGKIQSDRLVFAPRKPPAE